MTQTIFTTPLRREDDLRLQSLGIAMSIAQAKGKPTALELDVLLKEATKIHAWIIQDSQTPTDSEPTP